jgi:hypothetical protein
MSNIVRREIKITLKGDASSLDEIEELLSEALEAGEDAEVKSSFTVTKEVPLDEDPEDEEETEEADEWDAASEDPDEDED